MPPLSSSRSCGGRARHPAAQRIPHAAHTARASGAGTGRGHHPVPDHRRAPTPATTGGLTAGSAVVSLGERLSREREIAFHVARKKTGPRGHGPPPLGPHTGPPAWVGRCSPSRVGRISPGWDRIPDCAIAFHEAQPPLRTGKRGRQSRCPGHNLALRLQKNEGRIPAPDRHAHAVYEQRGRTRLPNGQTRARRPPAASAPGRVPARFATLRAVISTARAQGCNLLDNLAHPDPMQPSSRLRLRETGTGTTPDRRNPTHTNALDNQTWIVSGPDVEAAPGSRPEERWADGGATGYAPSPEGLVASCAHG